MECATVKAVTVLSTLMAATRKLGAGRQRPWSRTSVVDEDSPCISLVALQGPITLSGVFGRLLQPFIRL